MKIVNIQLGRDPVTLAPEMTVTLKMPMVLTERVITESERQSLLGKALMDALAEYKG